MGIKWQRCFLAVKAYLLVGLLCTTTYSIAQNADWQLKFNNGRILIDQGNYALAMKELLPVIYNSKSTHAPDAAYLYASAAYKSGSYAESAKMLTRLENDFSNWAGMPDAFYLHALANFEQQKYDEALKLLSKIPDNDLKNERSRAKVYYLAKINDPEQFELLLKQFPDDKEIAVAYATFISQNFTQQNSTVLNKLIEQYRLDKNLFSGINNGHKKAAYKIAVLLPFGLEQNSAQAKPFAVDLYQGIKYAADSINKNVTTQLELFAYNAGTDTSELRRLLDLPEIKAMDLLIGPVYKNGTTLVQQFSNTNHVPVINPLSQDGEQLKGNPFLYLYEPSFETKAQRLAAFAFSNFKNDSVIVLYENRREDSAIAHLYKKEFEKLGGKIQIFKKLNPSKSANTTAVLSALDLNGMGSIACFSENAKIAVNTVSLVESKDFKGAILVPSSWLEIQQLTLEQLDAREFYFLASHHSDPVKTSRFRKGYKTRVHIPPSVYSETGFELMWFFGQALQQYGSGFTAALVQTGYKTGSLYNGFDYSKGNDNAYVPLLKLENLKLLRANQTNSPINLLPPPANESKQTEQR